MLKKILPVFAVAAMAAPALAGPESATVPVTVTVNEAMELYANGGAVELEIDDGGANGGETNAVSRILKYLSNVDAHVSVQIDGDIPVSTQFHILIRPEAGWTSLISANAEKVISWRREASGYQNATTVPVGLNVNAADANDVVPAFDAPVAAALIEVPVQYFAAAPNGVPPQSTTNFDVIWTIAPDATP